MPVYEYTALNAQGKKHKGVLDADSTSAARQKIRKDGSYPVEIKETFPRGRKKRKEADKKNLISLQFGARIKQQEIHVATRQLATLLGAGIPLVPALSGLIEQTTNKALQTKITQIKESVNEGNSLTSSLAEHPRLFSKIYVNMVQAGEASGSLDVVLERLAEVGERQQAMRSRIAAALIYPIFMAFVGIGVLFLLITFIVPSITKVFTDRDQALPLPTTILISLSDFLQNYWIIIVFLIIGLIIGIRFFIQQPKGQRLWDTLKLSFPVLRDLNIKIAAATLGRTMSSLLESGVPLITSLGIVKNILNNVLLADVMDLATEELEKGKSLSSVLRGNKYFTPMLVQMIAVGEQSGSLEKMLEKAADSYEKEVETKVLAMTSMIEPIMILVMGLAVSFIVISILLPIFEMNQLIK
ncbi:type II secretion system inner membrane protein GspF [Desulfobulbus sp. US1]|nr:type II secretion system inner membrane protein GspF [Desulfobulbus sp. US4]MCW5207190.1 type II secretion system inner membrane protein GspF [Desulfobulbus sp. US2]MCW5208762.1 type II secretion system inner membrane protein GspF [Desulfobulbus sp. US1]MCW5210371.1 type II secretion system inner membrane protein GspF [Desulfobulbus sp. N3]